MEVKALSTLSNVEFAQLLNYQKATGVEIGLVINFGEDSLNWKRLVRTRERKK